MARRNAQHTDHIIAEIEVDLPDGDVAYPEIEITFAYTPGYADTRHEPGEGPQIEFIGATVVSAGGLHPDNATVDKWAEAYLGTSYGRSAAIETAQWGE